MTAIDNETTMYRQLAEVLIKKHPYFYDKSKIWWLWNFKKYCWEIIDEIDIMNVFDTQFTMSSETPNTKLKILEALKKIGRKNIPKEAKKTWIQFKDKIVDIKDTKDTKTITSWIATSEWFVTNPIPWELGEKEDTLIIDKIFKEWVGEKYVKTLYEICAYCLLCDYPLHRIFCLLGSGCNGKSKFIGLINKLVGKDNSTTSELDLLLNSKFEKSKLFKKLVCSIGESNFTTLQKTAALKQLTGQDKINFEFKFKNPFDDYNYAKIIMAANTLPVTLDKTPGFYRRVIVTNFPNTFTEKKNILDDISDEEYKNLCRKSIRILKELITKGEFNNEGDFKFKEDMYEELSNPLKKFIKEFCYEDVNVEVPFYEFYGDHIKFLSERKYRIQSKIEVSKQLKDDGYEIKTKSISKDNGDYTTWRFILGLNLKKNKEEKQGDLKEVFNKFENKEIKE